jgi:hypothetical protein
MAFLTMVLPRRYALVPILVVTCYIPLGQQVVVAGLNFTMMRIIILVGLARVFLNHEYTSFRLNRIDKILLLWVASNVVMYNISHQTTGAFVNRLGFAYNALGMYFLFRFMVSDLEDAKRVLKMIAVVIIPLALLMTLEKMTGRNVFSIFGGIPEFTTFRGDRLRCQGPFSHPILAGTLGATIMPLCIALWWEGRRGRFLAALGCISATMIVFFTASTGPAMAYATVIVGMMMWPFRRYVRAVMYGGFLAVLALDLLIMKARVWFLIGRISNMLGGSGHGYYRSILIDEAVKHINEWWLFGTNYTAHWNLFILEAYPDQVDITNHFIRQGVDGGLLTMILFIMIIIFCFRAISRSLRSLTDQPFAIKILLWSLGVALLAHVASFMSVSYFDQMVVFWYLLLALISTTTGYLIKAHTTIQPTL